MKKIIIFLSALIISLTLMSQSNVKLTMNHNNTTRKYTVHLPSNYDETKSYPLVINMHGLSGNNTSHMNYSDFNTIADTGNFIVVYPQGLVGTTAWGVTTTQWNSYFGTGTKDLEFLDTLIDQMYYDYQIDLKRVYSTGHSNGGFMSYMLACELSERIAAIASVCGAMAYQQENNCTITHPMPILQFHGTEDATVPYSGQPLFHSSIPDLMNFWKNKNNCTLDSTKTTIPNSNLADSCSASISDFSICDTPSQVQLYTITNGGHSWPGAVDYPPLGNTCQDFNASSIIWNFFNQYKLNNPVIPEELNGLTKLKKEQVTIKPNPFTGYFNIELINSKINSISIMNIFGKLVYESSITNRVKINIDGSNFKKGIYFVKVNDAIISKIIKN